MGRITKVSTSGFKEMEAAMTELGSSSAKRLARAALRRAAQPIHEAYRENTTVETGVLLGNTNMGVRLNPRQRRMTPKPKKSEIVLHIGTADPAGIQQEFGNRHQQAAPALTPAWDAEGGETALDRIGNELGPAIEKAAARAAKRRK